MPLTGKNNFLTLILNTLLVHPGRTLPYDKLIEATNQFFKKGLRKLEQGSIMIGINIKSSHLYEKLKEKNLEILQ